MLLPFLGLSGSDSDSDFSVETKKISKKVTKKVRSKAKPTAKAFKIVENNKKSPAHEEISST